MPTRQHIAQHSDKLTAPAAAVRAHNIPWLAAPAAPSCLDHEGPANWLDEPHMHRLPRLLVQQVTRVQLPAGSCQAPVSLQHKRVAGV